MKRILVLIAVIAVVLAGVWQYSSAKDNKAVKEKVMTEKKVLIAYYSLSGNTKAVAEKIQNITGGDIFEIEPVKPYPNEYNAVVELAKREKAAEATPDIKGSVDVSKYDVIFVGTPVWWYTMATPVRTFVSKNDFSGKVIAPFCTHGGGGASATFSDIKKYASAAEVLEGFSTYENSADEKSTLNWINSLKI